MPSFIKIFSLALKIFYESKNVRVKKLIDTDPVSLASLQTKSENNQVKIFHSLFFFKTMPFFFIKFLHTLNIFYDLVIKMLSPKNKLASAVSRFSLQKTIEYHQIKHIYSIIYFNTMPFFSFFNLYL